MDCNTHHVRTLIAGMIAICIVTGLGGLPHTAAQDDPLPPRVITDFEHHPDNPVLTYGAPGEWDSGFIFMARVLFHDELFHMFYVGGEDFRIQPKHIGYATSQDGITWTKYADNPILQLDESFAPYGVRFVVPHVEGDRWVLYLAPQQQPGFALPGMVLRATADVPVGPWTVDYDPVLVQGEGRDWDQSGLFPSAIIPTPGGYSMYYGGFGTFGGVGLATSPNGTYWVKYDDPATDARDVRSSDPVFAGGERSDWDGGGTAVVSVLVGEESLEMFYSAGPGPGATPQTTGLGYATSLDGITWTRHNSAPFVTGDDTMFIAFPGAVRVGDAYYIYFTMFPPNTLDMQIGLAVGTVTREVTRRETGN